VDASPARRRASAAAWQVFAWAGAALFAASVGYFLYRYFVAFGEITAGTPSPALVAANVALFSAFALHHSIFARERVRALIARRVSPAAERSIYVWIASLMLIGVCALWQPIPGVAWDVRGPAAWALRVVQLFGVWLTLRGAAVINIWELSGVSAARLAPDAQRPTPAHDKANSTTSESGVSGGEFKTEGPYGWVRHPIYLGWFLLVFTVPLMTMTRLVFALVSGIYILIAIPLEERSLLRTSGGTYEHYRRQIRWKLLPGIY